MVVRATTADGSAIRKERSWAGMCPLLAFAAVGLTLPLCRRPVSAGGCASARGSSSSSFSSRGAFGSGCSTAFFLGVSALTLPRPDLVVFARLGKWLR